MPIVPIKRNRLICVLMLLIVMCTQTSCWDKVEIERLAIVTTIAVERAEDGNYLVALQVINPQALAGGNSAGMGGGGGGGQVEAYRNISDSGKTIFEAVRKMNAAIPRELYFSHNQLIIISDKVAREGIGSIIDFFDRNPQIRRNNYVLICEESNVELNRLLNIDNPLEVSLSNRIVGIIKEQDRIPIYAITQLGDFLELLSKRGADAYTAGVTIATNPAAVESVGGGGDSGRYQEKGEEIYLRRTAIFDEDKMVGWLDENESRGLLWVREGLNGGIYNVDIDQADGEIALEVRENRSQLKPYISEDGRIIMQINIKASARVNEVHPYLDLSQPQNITKLEKSLCKAIKRDVLQAIKTAQHYSSDVFGFGAAIHRRYPEYWRQIHNQWDEVYPEVEVEINVECKVYGTGLVSRPLKPME